MDVAFLGLGIMGSRMAARVTAGGHRTTVWSRSGSGAEAAVAAGATRVADVAAAVRDADVVVSMLWDDAVARAVVRDTAIPAARSGATILEMTTISPEATRELASAAAARGLGFVAAPVTGSADAAATGTLTALVGGAAAARARVGAVLDAMTAQRVDIGDDPAAAATFKLANNAFIATLTCALGDALALAAAAGVDEQQALAVLCGTAERVTKMKAPKILARDPKAQFSVDGSSKDTAMALAAAERAGTPADLFAVAATRLRALQTAGRGGDDFSIVAMPAPRSSGGRDAVR